MPDRRNGRLHHKNVRPRLLGNGPVFLRLLRNRGNRRHDPGFFHLLHALRDQLLLDRRDVHFLDQVRAGVLVRLGNLRKHVGRILIAGLHPLQVQHRQPAHLPHRHRKLYIHHPVHGRGQNRHLEGMLPDRELRVDLARVDRHIPGHEGNLVKPVGDTCFPVPSDPHAHRSVPFSRGDCHGMPGAATAAAQGVPGMVPRVARPAMRAGNRLPVLAE